MAFDLGTTLQVTYDQEIQKEGEQLSVVRDSAVVGTANAVQSLWCVAKPLALDDTRLLAVEGLTNASEANPHMFTFAGGSDVQEVIDRVVYDGWYFRVVNVNSPRRNSVPIKCYAIGVRETPYTG